MNSPAERLEYFAERHARGQLSPDDIAELEALCATPANARQFIELLAEQHEWRQAGAAAGVRQAFVDVIVSRARSPKRSGRFVKAVTAAAKRDAAVQAAAPGVSARRSVRRPAQRRSFVAPAMLAAGVAAAVALVLVFQNSGAPGSTAPLAMVTELSGSVSIQRAGRTLAAAVGTSIEPDDALETSDGSSLALQYANENTHVRIRPASSIVVRQSTAGKRLDLTRGSVAASVAVQPQGKPLVIAGRSAEAKVVGTRLLMSLELTGTKLQVDEGKVLLTRLADSSVVEVSGGNIGFAPADTKLALTVSPFADLGPWVMQDVGRTATSVRFSDRNGTLTLTGSGEDIYNTAEAFGFAHKTLLGDGTISVRVVSVENVDEWAQAGIMLRANLTTDAVHGTMLVTPSGRVKFRSRAASSAAGGSTGLGPDSIALPYWIKLVRQGDKITGYRSNDGQTYSLSGELTYAKLPEQMYVGLFVTDRHNKRACTAVFDQLTITPANAPDVSK